MYVSCWILCFTSRVKNIESRLSKVTPLETMFPPIATVNKVAGEAARFNLRRSLACRCS